MRMAISQMSCERPTVGVAWEGSCHGAYLDEFLREVVKLWIVRPGFNQQYLAVRVFTQPGSEYTA
jgi:hypothetical protein